MIWLMIYVVGLLAMLEYLLHYGLQQPELRARKVFTAVVMGVLWPALAVALLSVFEAAYSAAILSDLFSREKVDKE